MILIVIVVCRFVVGGGILHTEVITFYNGHNEQHQRRTHFITHEVDAVYSPRGEHIYKVPELSTFYSPRGEHILQSPR